MTEASNTSWAGRAILHVDMDAFFASVEQLDHPEWRGKPVLVGGSPDGRGVVAAASYEAREFGVHSAMPSAQAARLCPDAIWAKGRFDRYRELSGAICDIFSSITPHVQQVSIDEAYLDITPTGHRSIDPVQVAREIQQRVDAMGLSCSIGVGSSKTVVKIASDHHKPHGITVVRPGDEAAFLAPLPVVALPGIGAATAERLRNAGVRTLGDLAALDDDTAGQLLGSFGADLAHRAAGIDMRPVRDSEDVKSVSHERTFPADVRERKQIEHALAELVVRVAERLRRHSLSGRTLTVKLRYGDFTTKTVSRTLGSATDLDAEMLPVAVALLRSAWTPGTGLRLIGFGVSGFADVSEQLDLFAGNEDDRPRHRALAKSLDEIRRKYGSEAITLGADDGTGYDSHDE